MDHNDNTPETVPVLKKPCDECPFRRGTQHSGGAKPEQYIGQAMGPFLLPCHKSPGYYEDKIAPTHIQCAGAAIYRANIKRTAALPPNLLQAEPDKDLVFATPQELFAHHAKVPLRFAELFLERYPPAYHLRNELTDAGVHVFAPGSVPLPKEQP